MKLGKNIKRAIVVQFKGGASVEYLATLYQVTQDQVERVIRDRMLENEKIEKAKLL